MTKAEKNEAIAELQEIFSNTNAFYVTDYSTLNVEQISDLRRMCFEKGVQIKVLKNTLVKKALERIDADAYTEVYEALKGPTAVMFSETANMPARILKDFRKSHPKPELKAAFIDSDVYFGDDQIEILSKLKSREELIGDIIGLLQSPIKNVLGGLQSGGNTIAGLLKALEEREA